MGGRRIVVYISAIFFIACVILGLYFFARKPVKVSMPVLDEEKKVIIFKDVKYTSEKKGLVDWEINAKVAKKHIENPLVELEGVEGYYKPKPDVTIFFVGRKGFIDTEKEEGRIEEVDFVYKNSYRLKSSYMEFYFKRGITQTEAPVVIEGTKLQLRGLGLKADTEKEVVVINKDVTGVIETEKGRYKFESDRFSYALKDNVYTLNGRVIMKGEDMNLMCDNLYLFTKGDNELEKIDAIGRVRLISKGTLAKSEKAVYHFMEDRVVLTERPKLLRDNVEMEGESIVYNPEKRQFSINKPRMRLEK
ncbi:MAG: LPS export ABC transporter periplasmic protein LptC [Syntrophorhabdaceae bacterium]|nr:LPS export ABC transporter periplasmic protein LptC [Syntrophorhabdaceae bacterium]